MVDVISPIVESLPTLVIVFAAYTYLLYIALFKKGRFTAIKDLEELGKLILLFIGLFISILSVVFGVIFLSHVMFATTLPTDLTSDMQPIIFSILAFVFLPYMMKKEAEKNKKKFDLGDWFFFILLFNLWIVIFSLVSLIYVSLFGPKEIINFFFGIILLSGIIFLMSIAYLKVVLTRMFKLKKRKYFDKRALRLIILQIVISIVALVLYLLFTS